MTELVNTFEGGSSGTGITIGNSGGTSGDAWSGVDMPTGGVAEYSDVSPMEGLLGGRFGSRATSGTTGVYWNSAKVGSLTDFYFRFYLRFDTPDTWNSTICTALSGSLSDNMFYLNLTTAPALNLRNSADGSVVSSPDLTAGNVYRVEGHVHVDATAGYVTIRIYADPTAAVEDYTYELNGGTPTTWAMTATSCGFARFGGNFNYANWPTATGFAYLDAIAFGRTSGWYGPVEGGVPLVSVYPAADIAAGSWTPSAGATLFGTIEESPYSDSDYDESSSSPGGGGDEFKVRLGTVSDPGGNTDHKLSYRYAKDYAGGDRIDLTVTLYAANGTTVIASWTHTDIAGSVTPGEQTLTAEEADAIPSADYATGLVLGFKAVKV